MNVVDFNESSRSPQRKASEDEMMGGPALEDLGGSMAALSCAELNASADASRDRGDWRQAAITYSHAVRSDQTRDDLRIQAGNCFKEAGEFERSFQAYLGVKDVPQRDEAMFQLGHLMKVTGNFKAAQRCYEVGAAKTMDDATIELGRRSEWRMAASASSIELLCAAEIWSQHCALLASCVPLLNSRGLTKDGSVMAYLSAIVAGPARERRFWLQETAKRSEDWPEDLTTSIFAKRFSTSTNEALLALNGRHGHVNEAERGEMEAAWPPRWLTPLADLGSSDALIDEILAKTRALASRIFAWAPDQDRGDLQLAIQDALHVKDRIEDCTYLSFNARQSAASYEAVTARRVTINAFATIMSRLETALQQHANEIGYIFHLPTTHANAATDCERNVMGVDDRLEGPPASDDIQRLHEKYILIGATGTQAPEEEWEAIKRLAAQGKGINQLIEWSRKKLEADGHSGGRVMEIARSLKDQGEWTASRDLVQAVLGITNDIGTVFEFGIISKTLGDYDAAARSFRTVLDQQPYNADAARELAAIAREAYSDESISSLAATNDEFAKAAQERRILSERTDDCISSEVSIRRALESTTLSDRGLVDFGHTRIEMLQLGWLRQTVGDTEFPLLSGIVAIRAKIISKDVIAGVRVRLRGRTVQYCRPVAAATDDHGNAIYYANAWLDVSSSPLGIGEIQIYVEFKNTGYMTCEHPVVIGRRVDVSAYPNSDAILDPARAVASRDVDAVVAKTPPSVRPSARLAFQDRVASVLIMRLDQLGDVAASLSAMQRLRRCFPAARFEALVTPANKVLVETTGLFDAVTAVPFPYEHQTRRRRLSKKDEQFIVEHYAKAGVDVAVDLSPGDDSRPVLKLIKSRYKMGFKPGRFDFLDFGIELHSRDAVNRKEMISHTSMVNALAEAIAVAVSPPPERLPPPASSVESLWRLGLERNSYVVLHSGARLAIKKWPLENYVELAQMIRKELGCPVVFIAEDSLPLHLRDRLKGDPAILIREGLMDFGDFDAVVSNALLFVGNDTGPKHLASVRGVFTVSVHMGQVNWNEWGQDGAGFIVSKRVPCCGCGIEDVSECGKDLACLTLIAPSDILDVVVRYVRGGVGLE